MPVKVSMTVNGKPVTAEVEARSLLVSFLREQLHLTGTHVGCDTAQCGACTIHMNGKAVKCCNMLVMQADGAQIVTIEGIAARRRQAASDAGGLPRPPWAAVRLLHARDGDERHRPGQDPPQSQ